MSSCRLCGVTWQASHPNLHSIIIAPVVVASPLVKTNESRQHHNIDKMMLENTKPPVSHNILAKGADTREKQRTYSVTDLGMRVLETVVAKRWIVVAPGAK